MGYYASGGGEIHLRPNLTESEWEKVKGIVNDCDIFDGLWLYSEDNTILVSHGDKYRSDWVADFMHCIQPFVKDGELIFVGEDNAHWKIVFEDENWMEYDGEVVYKEKRELQ